MERTLIILKPDAVQRKLVGEIIQRFEQKNFKIIHMKTLIVEREVAEEHYAHIRELSIFKDMIDYFTSGTAVAIILEGERAIQTVRGMIGKTSCFESLPGTIRGDFGLHAFQNLIHASDAPESVEVEIKRFFPELQ